MTKLKLDKEFGGGVLHFFGIAMLPCKRYFKRYSKRDFKRYFRKYFKR